MKTITLHIPDDVYAKLRNSMGVRIMTGAAYGLPDDFVRYVIANIDKGNKELTFEGPPKDKKA